MELIYPLVGGSLPDQRHLSDYSHWGQFSDRLSMKESPRRKKKKQKKLVLLSMDGQWKIEDEKKTFSRIEEPSTLGLEMGRRIKKDRKREGQGSVRINRYNKINLIINRIEFGASLARQRS